VEEHLDAGLTLEQLAAAAHLSVYHFARQFKAATGLPPHQYVILRRVERAKQLLQGGGDLSLAEVAARASSPATSSDWSASRRGSSGRPQESPNSPQFPPRNSRVTRLPFSRCRLGRRAEGEGRSAWTRV